jgi:plasmid stability protein
MPTLHVRNVPEDLHEHLQRLAERKHRSLSAEVIALLERALQEEETREAQAQLLTRIRRRRSRYAQEASVDSVNLLREDRER